MHTNEEEASARLHQTLGGKYLVRRLIGVGGMGAVYEVEHVFTKRTGALKLLHSHYASVPEVALRFVREASAAGRIGNRHIVETIDAGTLPSGEPYIFMELLSGTPLREIIQRRGKLELEEALQILVQATEGLESAHAAGIVHRDVKPDNLFVCDGQPFIKVLDFGVSRFMTPGDNQKLTAEGAPIGTPYYMSPEQVVAKQDLDARTDVYSLGVVLYECLSGRLPFTAESLAALGIRIFEGKYAPLSEFVPNVPPELDAVVARALAVDPNQRYESMAAFRAALIEIQRLAMPADTLTFSVPVHSTFSRVGATLVLLVGLGALLALGSRWMFSAAPPTVPPTREASAIRATEPTGNDDASLVLPADIESTSAASRTAEQPLSVRPPVQSASPKPATPARAPDAQIRRKSRAAEDGLSTRNPFSVDE